MKYKGLYFVMWHGNKSITQKGVLWNHIANGIFPVSLNYIFTIYTYFFIANASFSITSIVRGNLNEKSSYSIFELCKNWMCHCFLILRFEWMWKSSLYKITLYVLIINTRDQMILGFFSLIAIYLSRCVRLQKEHKKRISSQLNIGKFPLNNFLLRSTFWSTMHNYS